MISAPQMLIAFRAACAPTIFILACFGFPGPLLAGILCAAFASDVLDGVLARRNGTATADLRYADTLVDTAFYVAAAGALWVAVPGSFQRGEPTCRQSCMRSALPLRLRRRPLPNLCLQDLHRLLNLRVAPLDEVGGRVVDVDVGRHTVVLHVLARREPDAAAGRPDGG